MFNITAVALRLATLISTTNKREHEPMYIFAQHEEVLKN